jgi:hypothetical protein
MAVLTAFQRHGLQGTELAAAQVLKSAGKPMRAGDRNGRFSTDNSWPVLTDR